MSHLRVLRTIAYRRFGVFRAREVFLRRGLTGPCEQIAALACFFQEGLGNVQDLAFAFGTNDTVEATMQSVLERTLDASQPALDSYFGPLSHLALQVEPLVTWDPFQDFAELLSAAHGSVYGKVAARLRARFGLSVLDAAGFCDSFMLSVLPEAVRKFDLRSGRRAEAAWLETVLYRYCLKRTLTDLHAQRQLREMGPRLVEKKMEPWSEDLVAADDERLYEALDQLPAVEQRALQLYFGLLYREHTIHEVSIELACSEYHARAAILRGVARLAVKFHARGALTKEEFQLVERFLGEGKPLPAAAAELDLKLAQASKVLTRVQEKFARVLRARTSMRRLGVKSIRDQRERITMPDAIAGHGLSNDEILTLVAKLKEAPSIRTDAHGHPTVRLGNQQVLIIHVRALLRERPEKLEQFIKQRVPLDWLTTSDPISRRADLPADRASLQQAFDALAARLYEQARLVAALWQDALRERKVTLPGDDFDEVVGQVLRVLGGLSQAIEAELPRALRRTANPRFRVDRSERGVFGRWEGCDSEPIDINRLALHRASLSGNLQGAPAEELSRVIVDRLFDEEKGGCVLPSFRIDQTTTDTTWLLWSVPSLLGNANRGG